MPQDRWGHPFFYPSKQGGFFYEMSDNPKNDEFVEWPPEMNFDGGGVVSMDPTGRSTDFGIGKNISGFNDSIGGCSMDFAQTAERGYAYKPDDPRDVEIKILVRADDIGDDGIAISACTGHHQTGGNGGKCCQGFAYMIDTNMNENPSSFRFRKEMWHISYHTSPVGTFTDPLCNFKINNLGRYIGLGFCRYNDPNDIDGTVVVEAWFNPDPDSNKNNWKMIKRFKDTHGAGWGNDGDDCGGDSDQVGTWSNAQNRVKTNAGSGTYRFKQVSLREIDPSGSFDQDPNTPPPVPPNEPLKYTFSFKFGSKGNGNGQFQDPHDITFDATAANLWVCDRVRNDMQKFTSAGVFVSKFGSSGSGNAQFNVPYAVQIEPTFTYLYVCDRENNRIQKLTTSGTFVSEITTLNGKHLKKPEDICFNTSNGDIFICDTGNNRVCKINSSHTFILEWDGSAGGTRFDHPHSMDITTDNNFIIMSCGNQPFIQKYTTAGVFVKKWGSEGNGQGQVRTFLEHGDIDAFGRFHLINNDVRPIINVWDQDGNWLCQYGSTTSGSGDGQFKEPEHVTVHPDGRPYVVDAKNQRIQVFVPNFTTVPDPDEPPPPPPPPDGGGGGGTSKIIGSFTLLRDINIARESACQGIVGGGGGGGGSGGATTFYGTGVTPDNETKLSDSSTWSHRTRHAQKVGSSSSVMNGKIVKQINPSLLKTGSPASTPTISAHIWNSAGTTVYTSPTTIDPSTLPTSFDADPEDWPAFDFSTNTYALQVGDRVGIKYEGTSSSNYIRTGYESDPGEGSHWVSQMENGTWEDKKTRDWAVLLWQ
jgi:NHL repeat-containing protein